MDAIDGDLARAVAAARPDDGESWWAATRDGDRYPCRILNFERKSESLRAMFDDPASSRSARSSATGTDRATRSASTSTT